MDILYGNAHLHHQNHCMIGKVCQLIDSFFFIICLAGNDYLSTLLAHFFQDLVDTLFKKIGSVRAFRTLRISAHKHIIQSLQAKLLQCFALIHRIGEAGIAAGVAGRAVLFHHDHQRVTVAISGDGHNVLVVAAGLTLEP